jgi:hypothetical protein
MYRSLDLATPALPLLNLSKQSEWQYDSAFVTNNNVTADDTKHHLHVLLDGAIVAAQNNHTF